MVIQYWQNKWHVGCYDQAVHWCEYDSFYEQQLAAKCLHYLNGGD